jgi:outer membrane protein OmpA-like peptidoglycan-associated protein
VGNINFYGDSPELLPKSLGSVRALYMLMRKNAKLQIQIEGHVNAPHSDPKIEKYQKLSEWRARTVYEYLLDKGIAAGRMAPVGLSNREMLFPDARNEREMAANRRVEVKVLSVAGE